MASRIVRPFKIRELALERRVSEYEVIKEALENTQTLAGAAELLNVAPAAVTRWLKNNGLAVRQHAVVVPALDESYKQSSGNAQSDVNRARIGAEGGAMK